MIPPMRAVALVVVGAIGASCGGAATQAPSPPPASAAAQVAPSPAATSAKATAAAARPAFLSVRLTDVRAGEQFTLGGFPGKVVLGIAMAVW